MRQVDKLISSHMRNVIELCGLDLNDQHLRETPNRIARMYKEVFSSAGKNPYKQKGLVKKFRNDERYNQMIVSDTIPFTSFCSHHFVPFAGLAWVAYVPKNWISGLSKFKRTITWFSRKPQLQERLTQEVCEFLFDNLKPHGILIVMRALHECTRCRGVKNEVSSGMITSAFKGCFEDQVVRTEAFELIKLSRSRNDW